MRVQIATRKVALTSSFKTFVISHVTALLEQFAARIQAIQVELRDKNGRRGGGDKQVRIRILLAGGIPVMVEDQRASTRIAFRHAAARAATEVRKALARPR
jgi:putative sigma-54 modulation protein